MPKLDVSELNIVLGILGKEDKKLTTVGHWVLTAAFEAHSSSSMAPFPS
jgi:hypothetical protein